MTWTAEKNADLVKLYNQGYPETYIASWLDVEPARIAERLSQLGLAGRVRDRDRRGAAARGRSLYDLYHRTTNFWR
jgi:hypothetical protein